MCSRYNSYNVLHLRKGDMANTDIINLILTTTADAVTYLLPVLALMTGIVFIFSFLHSITIGSVRKTFKG